MSKHIVIFCDGTWQGDQQPTRTNVAKLEDCLGKTAADGMPQVAYYQSGVGVMVARAGRYIPNPLRPITKTISRLGAGAFGWGLSDKIMDAYREICAQYEPDDVIDIVGFSRGAYTARSLAGMIYKCGILTEKNPSPAALRAAFDFYKDREIKPTSPEAMAWRAEHSRPDQARPGSSPQHPQTIPDVRIGVMGLFDTVGSRGLPVRLPFATRWNRRYQFHDTKVNPLVEHVVHLVAGHEDSDVFDWTRVEPSWGADTQIHQIIMPGNHSGVGGGNGFSQGVADFAGATMAEQLAQHGGLRFDAQKMATMFSPDALACLNDHFGKRMPLAVAKTRCCLGTGDQVHPSFLTRAAARHRPDGTPPLPAMLADHSLVRSTFHIEFPQALSGTRRDALQHFVVPPPTTRVTQVRVNNGTIVVDTPVQQSWLSPPRR